MFYAVTQIHLIICILQSTAVSFRLLSSSFRLPPPILMSAAATELILNYLFTLFPEISYKEQTLLRQPINKGTSELLALPPSAK